MQVWPPDGWQRGTRVPEDNTTRENAAESARNELIRSASSPVGLCVLAFAQIDSGLRKLISLFHQVAPPEVIDEGKLRLSNQVSRNIATVEATISLLPALAPHETTLRSIIKSIKALKQPRDFLAHGWLDVERLQEGKLVFLKATQHRGQEPHLLVWETRPEELTTLARDTQRLAAWLLNMMADIMEQCGVATVSDILES